MNPSTPPHLGNGGSPPHVSRLTSPELARVPLRSQAVSPSQAKSSGQAARSHQTAQIQSGVTGKGSKKEEIEHFPWYYYLIAITLYLWYVATTVTILMNYLLFARHNVKKLGEEWVKAYLSFVIIGLSMFYLVASVFFVWALKYSPTLKDSATRLGCGTCITFLTLSLPAFIIDWHFWWQVHFESVIQQTQFIVNASAALLGAILVWASYTYGMAAVCSGGTRKTVHEGSRGTSELPLAYDDNFSEILVHTPSPGPETVVASYAQSHQPSTAPQLMYGPATITNQQQPPQHHPQFYPYATGNPSSRPISPSNITGTLSPMRRSFPLDTLTKSGQSIAMNSGLVSMEDFEVLVQTAIKTNRPLELILREECGFAFVDAVKVLNILEEYGMVPI